MLGIMIKEPFIAMALCGLVVAVFLIFSIILMLVKSEDDVYCNYHKYLKALKRIFNRRNK